MASHTNPNKPRASKRKSNHRALKQRRKTSISASSLTPSTTSTPVSASRTASGRIQKSTVAKTSQALRQAAPLSNKKAKKLEKLAKFKRQRVVEESLKDGEVQMKDINVDERNAKVSTGKKSHDEGELGMDVD